MLSLHLGTLVFVVEVALAYLRWHSAIKVDCCILPFVNAALYGRCRFVQYGLSISPKHPTIHGPAGTSWRPRHSAIRPRSTWILFCLPEAPRSASFALWWCSCHKLGLCLQPLAVIADVRKHGAFRNFRAALIRRIISRSGLMCFPHRQRKVPLKT